MKKRFQRTKARVSPQKTLPPNFGQSSSTAPIIPLDSITPQTLRRLKVVLLNIVSASLVRESSFDSANSTSARIISLCKLVALYDPEFILKVALYARNELNIRSTPNFLLSIASNSPETGAYLRKYFNATVKLPSDWLDVVANYQVLPDRALIGFTIPACLRKVMTVKFPDFDSYQLAKYNKEGAIKRKKRKQKVQEKKIAKLKLKGMVVADAKTHASAKPQVTLKKMIRVLHMSQPPYAVMCLLGKKYPATLDQFRLSGLPGEFNSDLAGKRMKLPVPETWETLLSQKGNKAETWEELIEHKKLPFMAMLRNLRNLIFTGVHPKYHRWAMNKLQNEKTIASSKQFPFRFFSAYEVIPQDLDDFKLRLSKINGTCELSKPTKPDSAPEAKKRQRRNPITPKHLPTPELFEQYRAALDTAVKLATTHNVKPIRGSTVVFCDVSEGMNCEPSASVGKFKHLDQIGALLGLMCKHVCEDCEFMLFSGNAYVAAQLKEGSILDNMAVIEGQGNVIKKVGQGSFPTEYLEGLIARHERIDNLLILSNQIVVLDQPQKDRDSIANNIAKYRREINPHMLFVSVDLSGNGCQIAQGTDEASNPNDVIVSGFSDSILRFIAERGDTNQLQHVEHLDISFKLPCMPGDHQLRSNPHYGKLEDKDLAMEMDLGLTPPLPLRPRAKKPWKTARVFISSTFLDMHGERDLLTRKIFPELRERCVKRRIHLEEVDLRWGVTETESQEDKGVQVCLEEVATCQPFFIGFVGSRYGWCPPGQYPVPVDDDRFEWIREYPQGRSITELEMYSGAMMNKNPHAFFYFRDVNFAQQVPNEFRSVFSPESETAAENLERLRQNIRQSTRNVVTYPATWGGVVDGKPMASGLAPLHRRILDDLWNTIITVFPEAMEQDSDHDEEGEGEGIFHDTTLELHSRDFVGRKDLLRSIHEWANSAGTGILAVTGAPGTGKSAIAAQFARTYQAKNSDRVVITHFIGASLMSQSLRGTLIRLCCELEAFTGESKSNSEIPLDVKDLEREFARLLEAASFRSRVILILDGVDHLSPSNNAHSLSWLPRNIPVKVLLTMFESSEVMRSLRQFKQKIKEIAIGPLELSERRALVGRILARHHKKT